jgi:hypothetical protein
MLAKKLLNSSSDLPTRPVNLRPTPPSFEAVPPARTHLMLVHAPHPTPRGLAWARRGVAQGFDSTGLQVILRLERLNLG